MLSDDALLGEASVATGWLSLLGSDDDRAGATTRTVLARQVSRRTG